jgi:NAD-reducing hydrogenase small subunit
MGRVRLATIWLQGCSGCHMSFLDLDEFLVDLAEKVDLVFGPFVDAKEFPEDVDVVFVEGAVSTDEQLEAIHTVRRRSKVLVSFGDCAVTGNVTALRNPLGPPDPILQRSYLETAAVEPRIPQEIGLLPVLLDRVTPVHEVVPVDVYLPGCPPPADRIRAVVEQLLGGGPVHLEGSEIRFG